MNDFNINWNDVLDSQTNDPGFGALPVGQYPVRVTKAEVVKASTGNPMIKVTSEVTSGPYASRLLWTNIVFKTDSPGTMRMALQKLGGLGVSREWIGSTNPTLNVIADAIAQVDAIADVEQREWQGEMRNDVKMFKPADGAGVPAPPSVSEVPPAPAVPAPDVPPAPQVPAPADEAGADNPDEPF